MSGAAGNSTSSPLLRVKRLLPRAHETVSEKFALLLCHALLLPAPRKTQIENVLIISGRKRFQS